MHDNPILNASGEIVKAGCIIRNEKREILLVLNRDKQVWGIPKGHAELHETPVETAIRETMEETGLQVAIIKTLEDLEYTDKHERRIRIHYFLANPVEQISNGEHEQKWVSYDEALITVLPHVKQYLLNIRESLAL